MAWTARTPASNTSVPRGAVSTVWGIRSLVTNGFSVTRDQIENPAGYLLTEAGGYLLTEDGARILLDNGFGTIASWNARSAVSSIWNARPTPT